MSPTEPTILRYDRIFSLLQMGYSRLSPNLLDYCKEEMQTDFNASLGALLVDGQPRVIQWLGWEEKIYNHTIHLSGSYKITVLESDTDANTD